jgi:hypothetical protein
VTADPTNLGTTAAAPIGREIDRRVNPIVVEAFFDIADTIITVRSLIRRAWTTHRWDTRPPRRP